jgi:hypothetical protein
VIVVFPSYETFPVPASEAYVKGDCKMNLQKVTILLLALLLAGMAIVPIACASSSDKQPDKTPVTLDYAKNVAQVQLTDAAYSLPAFSGWKDAGIENDMTFYDLEGDITAYSFSVVKNKEKQGFILISAIRENYPVLEFGKGDVIPNKAKETANRIARDEAETKSLTPGSSRFLYLGPTFYYEQYQLSDSLKNTEQNVIIDLFNQKKVDQNDTVLHVASSDSESRKDLTTINSIWKKIDEKIGLMNRGVAIPLATRGTKTIYGVPLYDQPSGYPGACAPTASGMILSYWRNHGYTNFPSNGDTLIAELYSAMGTSYPQGTPDSNLEAGIESVSQSHGYNIDGMYLDRYSISFSGIQSEINANRPIHLSMHGAGAALGQTETYDHHSVAVVGWANGAFDALELNDGWSTSVSRYIVYGNWNYVNAVFVQP